MGRYISLPVLLVVAILQSTIIAQLRIFGGSPDLILMLVLSWTMLAGLQEGVVWAMVGGILQDLLTGIPTGTTALVLVILAFTTDLIVGEVDKHNLVIPPLVIAVGTVAYQLLLAVLLGVFGRSVPIGYMLLSVTLPTLIIHVLMILPVFRIAGWMYTASRPRRVTMQ